MNKFIIIMSVCFSGFISMLAQTDNTRLMKPMAPSMEDYISLLNRNGYEAFSFDISSLLDGQYEISFILKEYNDGNLVKDNHWAKDKLYIVRTNMSLLSDFPEESQENIKAEEMADPERGIYSLARKITVGFAPAENDSVKNVMVDLDGESTRYDLLALHPQFQKNDSIAGKKFYMYYAKPFKTGGFTAGQFVPLVLYGSAWYDKEFGIHRFCGEDDIDPDMSSRILKDIPHYYVIGIEVKPIKMLSQPFSVENNNLY